MSDVVWRKLDSLAWSKTRELILGRTFAQGIGLLGRVLWFFVSPHFKPIFWFLRHNYDLDLLSLPFHPLTMVENGKNTDKIAIQSFAVPRARE